MGYLDSPPLSLGEDAQPSLMYTTGKREGEMSNRLTCLRVAEVFN